MPTVISPDKYLINEDGEYEWTPERSTQAWDRAYVEFAETIGRNRRTTLLIGIPGVGKTTWLEKHGARYAANGVFFDATLTNRLARQPLIEIVRERLLTVEAIVFQCSLITCLRRNALRPDGRRVPHATITKMAADLRNEPPTLDEGFTRLTLVNTDPH